MKDYRFSDLEVGMEAEFRCIPDGQGGYRPLAASQENLDWFRDMTGDGSPIHVDEAYARERGFAGKVCYGMLVSAFYSTLIGVYLPGKRALFQEAHISMVKPVYVGDRLTVRGRITGLNEALKRVTVKAKIVRDDGETVSRARLEAGVAE